jgi:integrase
MRHRLQYVKTVRRGTRVHLYFNTGRKVDGKLLYTPLPPRTDASFPAAYAAALSARSKRHLKTNALSVPKLIELWQRHPDFTQRAQGTQKTYGVYLRQLAHAFNNAPADAVEDRDIIALMDQKAEKPAAADMLLTVASRLFGWAKKRRYIHSDPTLDVEPLNVKGSEHQPWPEWLIAEALEDEKVRLPVALLYFTAQRIGDCCAMRWNQVKDGKVSVVQEKTGARLRLEVHPKLADILAKVDRRGLTVLTGLNGRPAKEQTIRDHLQAFGEKHGVHVVPHGLRKNAVNTLLEAGCSTGEVSSVSGQSLRMVEHYAKARNQERMAESAMLKWHQNG